MALLTNHADLTSFNKAIQKALTIFGPDVVWHTLQGIPSLTLNPDGTVAHIIGDANSAAEQFLKEFQSLSEYIVKKEFAPLLIPEKNDTNDTIDTTFVTNPGSPLNVVSVAHDKNIYL